MTRTCLWMTASMSVGGGFISGGDCTKFISSSNIFLGTFRYYVAKEEQAARENKRGTQREEKTTSALPSMPRVKKTNKVGGDIRTRKKKHVCFFPVFYSSVLVYRLYTAPVPVPSPVAPLENTWGVICTSSWEGIGANKRESFVLATKYQVPVTYQLPIGYQFERPKWPYIFVVLTDLGVNSVLIGRFFVLACAHCRAAHTILL